MANLYKRPGSPFWWLKSRGPDRRIHRKSLGLLVSSPAQTRKARILASQANTEELQHTPTITGSKWESWVPGFIAQKYGDSPRTLERYDTEWRNLYQFMKAERIQGPAALSYQACMKYHAWRQEKHTDLGLRAASHNTARLEIKFLGVILREAKRRGFVSEIVSERLGIKRHRPKEKPEIPEEHLAIISKELETRPDWMRTAFQIGLHTGLRLTETNLWMPSVDVAGRSMLIPTPKGGADRAFSIPMDEPLVPLLERLKRERAGQHAFDWPKAWRSKPWWQFFREIAKKHGLPVYCFHCLRVTFITRGARAGIPERDLMRLVNHASSEIHRIYQRTTVDDLREYQPRMRPNLPPAASPDSAGNAGEH